MMSGSDRGVGTPGVASLCFLSSILKGGLFSNANADVKAQFLFSSG